MRLTQVQVTNFRALKHITVRVEDHATLIVGRNNSGKTSFASLFDRFYGTDETRFVPEDLHTSRIAQIRKAFGRYVEAQKTPAEDPELRERLLDEARGLLPEIRLLARISYTVEDDLALLSEIILDLDERCFDANLEAVHAVKRPDEFLAHIKETRARQKQAFSWQKYLRKNFSSFFGTTYWAVSANAPSVRREISSTTARRIITVRTIQAQTKFDDTPADKTRTLSKTFEAFYKANSGEDQRDQNIESIDTALSVASESIDKAYGDLFTPFLGTLQVFGVGSIDPLQVPRIVTQIEPGAILRGSTRIQYPSPDGTHHLPEGHNGLGYSRLIFTLMQVTDFILTCQRSKPRPALPLLFIEEPEAHLHPQMQEVFINSIKRFLEAGNSSVQSFITTHSSHIVASSGFSAVRYFDSNGPDIVVKDLSTFQANTKKTGSQGAMTMRFLTQYMQLHRCDMFFADKVILIEGTVERLLLRPMISKCAPKLESQYISIIEVGGAFAHRFKELLEFINVPTLIITDLDSVDPTAKNGRCSPDTGNAVTSNHTLKSWLPRKKEIKTLLDLPEEDKSTGRVRVAYEVPEHDAVPCGRSFEDAFIVANAELFARNLDMLVLKGAFTAVAGPAPSSDDITSNAYEIAERLSDTKTDFAFDILLMDGWTVPRYIREGLEWLS
ncbi:AAA family ATPase [Kitasatospora sp. NPDC091335]|uniref:AAA family ATPase n=1 Tax=Kitasatospora sp. NPDC091335 TaxID=3364085 RepID=UPI00382E6166